MGIRITDKVTWVGKTDWELKTFHGEEYSTHRGTSYNSFLLRDGKTALIDTVWKPYDVEFLQNLKQETDLGAIDLVVVNHAEVDHAGSLTALLREIPDVPVYCTANGVKSIRGNYHGDWNFVPVKTGDSVDLGGSRLVFVEAPMLHWPDTMFTYMTGENILFSTDAFGQHYAPSSPFDDAADQTELLQEALKYYANILTPFSGLVTKKIQEVLALGLPVDMICPSHGVLWRRDPTWIVGKYLEWAAAYQENRITLVYDTMWEATRAMAEAIARGIRRASPETDVRLFNAGKHDKNDIITEVFRSKAVLFGSSTVNHGPLSGVAGLLEMIRGLQFKNKKAGAFGSYGWSGEAVKQLNDRLKGAGFEVLDEGIRSLWVPDENGLAGCEAYGEAFAKAVG